MAKRWGIASDPKLLARIEAQERGQKAGTALVARPAKEVIQSAPVEKKVSASRMRAEKVRLANQDSRLDTVEYDPETDTLTICFVGAVLLSHNQSLRIHNAKLTSLKNTWSKRIESLTLLNLATYDKWKSKPDRTYPLIIEELYATGEGNTLDVESVVAACKQIIDALVKAKYIPDDSATYIAQPIAYTYKQPNNGLVMVLRPSPKPWGLLSDSTIEVAKKMPSLPIS